MAADILIVIPTCRGPEALDRAARSVAATANRARVIAYVDQGQEHEYRGRTEVELVVGPRAGPVAAMNQVVDAHLQEHRVFGQLTDDSRIVTAGWDEWLLTEIERLPNRIGVISAHHPHGSYVNFPFVSREWIQAVGWFYDPAMYHFCCDTLLEIVGDCTRLVRAPSHRFSIAHDQTPSPNAEHLAADAIRFLQWAYQDRAELVQRLRAAMVAS